MTKKIRKKENEYTSKKKEKIQIRKILYKKEGRKRKTIYLRI